MSGFKKTSDKQSPSAGGPIRQGGYVLRPVSDAARPVIKKVLPKSSVVFEQLFDVWSDLMLGTEASASIPEKLALNRTQQKDGILHVWTQTGAQATEMSFNKTMIMQKINAFFGYNLVADLRITAFPQMMTLSNDNKTGVGIANMRQSIPCQSLDKMLQDISNPALREVLKGFGSVLESNPSENIDITGEKHA